MKRNAAAEEGLAYSWGNAYYTDSSGRMITQAQLVAALRRYLEAHPGVSPWTLFNENPKILTAFAPELSVRSVISGLLCEEVWRRKGFEGIKALLNAGPGDPNYLNVMEDLIQVNKDNFDTTTRSLVGRP